MNFFIKMIVSCLIIGDYVGAASWANLADEYDDNQ